VDRRCVRAREGETQNFPPARQFLTSLFEFLFAFNADLSRKHARHFADHWAGKLSITPSLPRRIVDDLKSARRLSIVVHNDKFVHMKVRPPSIPTFESHP
jgi:hypothetical protein